MVTEWQRSISSTARSTHGNFQALEQQVTWIKERGGEVSSHANVMARETRQRWRFLLHATTVSTSYWLVSQT